MFKSKIIQIPLVVASLLSSPFVAADNQATLNTDHSEMAVLATSYLTTAMVSTSQRMIAVGDRGHIFINSTNQWQQVSVPSQVLLTNVYFVDDKSGWAVGHDATVLHTQDGGDTWLRQQYLPELDRPLLSVHFSDKNNGVVAGAYGMYFATTDGGVTWNKQFLDSLLPQEDVEYLAEIRAESEEEYQFEIASILPHFNAITRLKDGRMFLVGELGLIAFSSDDGLSWQRQEDIYQGSFFSQLETDSGALIVAGLRGNMFRSNDNAASWNKITLSNDFSINHLTQLDNGDIYASQNNGVILKSIDDGVSFSRVVLNKGQDMTSVGEFKQQVWLAGSKGLSQFQPK